MIRVEFDKWHTLNHDKTSESGNYISPKPRDVISWLENAQKNLTLKLLKTHSIQVNIKLNLGGFTYNLLDKTEISKLNKRLLNKETIRCFLENLAIDPLIYPQINDNEEIYKIYMGRFRIRHSKRR